MLAALLSASLLAPAAPVPKAKAEMYFPVRVGTTRVVEITAGGGTVENTETVTKSEVKGGSHSVTLERESSGRKLTFEFTVSGKGVFRAVREEPEAAFKPGAGETWTVERDSRPTTYTVGKVEEVKVPAGVYKAIPVVGVSDLGGEVFKTTTWYAPGVGVVKTVSGSGEGRRVLVLKKFAPGK